MLVRLLVSYHQTKGHSASGIVFSCGMTTATLRQQRSYLQKKVRLLTEPGWQAVCRIRRLGTPGELFNQGTFFWGRREGVGKVYVQVVVDVFCSLAFAKCLYVKRCR